MRFKSVWIVCLALASAVCHVSAEQAYTVFEANKEEILEHGLREAQGMRFGVGVGVPSANTPSSLRSAQGKSHLLATENLIRSVALADLDWPSSVSEESQRALIEYYRFSVSATISGITRVYQRQEGGKWITVVAVPAEQTTRIGKITFPELYRQLSDSEFIFSQRAPDEAIVELLLSRQQLTFIDRTPWEKSLRTVKFRHPHLRKLPVFSGRCIVEHDLGNWQKDYEKGMTAYGKGALPDAYNFFVSAAERSWSFNVFNMAGNVARRIGKDDEAVAFLLHAALIDSSKPFPWVHLAFVAKQRGDIALCENCCKEAEARNPDKWSRDQIAILRKCCAEMDADSKSIAPEKKSS